MPPIMPQRGISKISKMMGSNGNVSVSENDVAEGSATMVEIKIKTLDSQTYTLRVDKCVPVLDLKAQIEIVTGVLSEQQRLICRGKVLKDDELLSAYHVEDGHTLHLVARQPLVTSAENISDHPASDPASSSGHSHGSRVGPSVYVGSFNISEHGDGVPDLGRILSAVLGSIGITGVGSGSEEVNHNDPVVERASSLGGVRNYFGQQPDHTGPRDQNVSNNSTSSPLTAVPVESLQPLVIPDSLVTLSRYLTHLRQEFDTTVRGQNYASQAPELQRIDSHDIHPATHSVGPAGLPTPATLAEVVMSTRQFLNEHIEECLLQVARQMENQFSVTDPSERTRIQAYALRSGALLQNLGALLLELGRTMMTLRMGQTPADAVVNAGPAIFVSSTGPNPIMVQPLPFQPGTSFGAIPTGTVQSSSGFTGGSVGSGFVPRNIDIRIRTALNRRDPSGSQQTMQTPPPTLNNNTSAQQTAEEGRERSSTREPEVRVVPLRSLLAAVPAPVGHAAADSTHGSVGIFYPVLARVQHVSSGNSSNARATQASDQHNARNVGSGRSSMPISAPEQQNIGLANADGNSISVGGASNGHEFPAQIHDGLNQLLRTIFSGEHLHGDNVSHGTDTNLGRTGVAQDSNSAQEATPSVSEDGLLLSNILRHIMPFISESMGTTSNSSFADGGNSDRAAQDSIEDPTNSEQGSTSCPREPLSQPSPKRQKRE